MKSIKKFMFWACIALIIFITVVIKPLANLDELWNFNIARCISVGLVPYKDISMVSTPLLGFLLAIPIKIFGPELFVSRIFAIVLSVMVLAVFYKLLITLDIKKQICEFAIIILLVLLINFFAVDYNLLSLLFLLCIMIFEINMQNKKNWRKYFIDILIGIFAGFIICSKQSIGCITSIIAILNPLFFIKSKSDIKNTLKKICIRLIGILIPVGAFFIYLAINNAFSGFLDYSVYGVKTFTNKISYIKLLDSSYVSIVALSITVPIVLIVSVIKNMVAKYKKKENGEFFLLTVYSIAMMSIVYPISDNAHFVIAIVPTIALIIYSITKIIRKYTRSEHKYILEFIHIFSILTVLALALWIEISNNESLGMLSKYRYENHYKYIYISDDFYDSIEEVNKYIEKSEKTVYILDASASAYMIPLDRYNKNYDMFCIGNFGNGGEDSIIEKIKTEDALYMILREDNAVNWQNPTKVRSYIKENMEHIGSKNIFDIYRNKEVLNEEFEEESEQ